MLEQAKSWKGFPGGLVVKNPPASAGHGTSTPESGRSLGEEMATHSSIVSWEIPWTEEPDGHTKSWTRLSDLKTTTDHGKRLKYELAQ